MRRLRTELLAAARPAHAFSDAAVLQLDIAHLPTTAGDAAQREAQSLESFREQADPDRLPAHAERFLTVAQWAVARQVLRFLGDDEQSQRIRFTTLLASATGMRISELVNARVGRIEAQLAGHKARGT